MKKRLLFFVFLALLWLPGTAQNCFDNGEVPLDYELFDVFICHNAPDEKFFMSKKAVIHSTVKFHVQSLSSQGAQAIHQINFGDGQGFKTVEVGDVITINYSQAGYKQIRFAYLADANATQPILIEQTRFQVKTSAFPYQHPDLILEAEVQGFQPPCPGTYSANPADPFHKYGQPSSGKARAYIKYGNGNSQLTRPLFLVDGLNLADDKIRDPNTGEIIRYGNLGWDVLSMGLDETFIPVNSNEPEVFAEIPILFTEVAQAGYDIVLVDFEDGADYIQKNAELLMDLIQQVNALKAPVNGCTYENVIVGASMGGIISRYALTTMEAAGVDHEARIYLSLDSPHKGANIPLSLQSFVWYFAHVFPGNDAESLSVLQAQRTWINLNRPAPRQLLYENLYHALQVGKVEASIRTSSIGLVAGFDVECCEPIGNYYDTSVDYGCLHEGLQAELSDLGLPGLTLNAAIANGAANGVTQGYGASSRLLNVEKWVNLMGVDQTLFQAHMWALDGEWYEFETDEVLFDHVVYHGKRPVEFLTYNGDVEFIEYKMATFYLTGNADYPNYDHAPGSRRADLALQIVPEFQASPDLAQSIHHYKPYSCFIPTVSAFDLDTDDLFYPVTTIDPDNPDPGITSFDRIEYQDAATANEYHVQATFENRAWFNNEIRDANLEDLAFDPFLGSAYNEVEYNYGLLRKRIPSVEIGSGGLLRVNDVGLTAYRDEPAGAQALFEAHIAGSCGQPAVVKVQNGGQFILGSDPEDVDDKRADVFIHAGAKVQVFDGGTLRLQKGSRLIIEAGAELIIEQGAKVDLWWSTSTIHVQSGGKLTVNGSFDFSGSGYFQFDPGNELALGGPAFALTGQNAATRFIRLNKGAELALPPGKNLQLSKGLVEFEEATSQIKVEGGGVNLFLVAFEGVDYYDGSGIRQVQGTSFHASGCFFTNMSRCLILENMDDQGQVNLWLCQFTDFGIDALHVSDTDAPIQVRDCDFETSGNFLGAIILKEVDQLRLEKSTIHSVDQAETSNGVLLQGIRAFTMLGGEISNCRYGINAGPDIEDEQVIHPNNIDLIDGAVIADCEVGVYLIGRYNFDPQNPLDFTSGRLLMDCASLIDNETGVEGKDILFFIDALINSNCDDPGCTNVRANTFIRPGISNFKYFNVCYEEYDWITTVFARGNFWGDNSQLPLGNSVYLRQDCPTGLSIPVDYADYLSAQPENCPNPNGGPYPQDPNKFCGIPGFSTSDPIDEELYQGVYALWQGQMGQADSHFENVAFVDEATRNAASELCKLKIDLARTFAGFPTAGGLAPGVAGQQPPPAASERSVEALQAQLSLQPNPSGGLAHLTLPQGAYLIEVYNAFGQLLYSSRCNDGFLALDLSRQADGLYFVKVIDQAAPDIQVVKRLMLQ